jgi:hypothetical protein
MGRHSQPQDLASLQRNRRGLARAARLRFNIHAFQLAQERFGEAAEQPLLEFVGDAAHQEIAGEPHGRRRPMQPPPLAAQFEDRRGGKPHQFLREISTFSPRQRPRRVSMR